MNYYEVFGISASVLSVSAFIPYVLAIFNNKTKPSGASWWTWTLLNFIALISSKYAGAPWQVLFLPIWLCASELGVSILSIKYGDNNWDIWNKLCIVGAGVGVVLWMITGQPLLALMISVFADLCASIPTFRHVWTKPMEEDRLAWTLGWGSAVLELFAVSHWSLAESGWAIYFLINMTIIFLLVSRPIWQNK